MEEPIENPEIRKYVYRLAGPKYALESKTERNQTIEDPAQKSSFVISYRPTGRVSCCHPSPPILTSVSSVSLRCTRTRHTLVYKYMTHQILRSSRAEAKSNLSL